MLCVTDDRSLITPLFQHHHFYRKAHKKHYGSNAFLYVHQLDLPDKLALSSIATPYFLKKE
jgi:hypothetical protein